MLRDLIVHEQKAAETTYKADVAMATGMAVIKNVTDGTAELPSAETAENLFFTQKERIPTGRNAGVANHSDYDTEFNSIAKDERMALYQYDRGEKFATDAVGSLTDSDIGKVLSAGTDGKMKVASAAVASRYQYLGAYNDAGHKLAKIYVLQDATNNA